MAIITTGLTSDTHSNVPRRAEEARRVMDWMIDDWKARDVNFIGVAGDVVDGPMTEQDRLWLMNWTIRAATVAPVGFCQGNHDPRYSLRFLSHLATKHPVFVEEGADVHVVETKNGKLAVVGVAFPWKAELLAKMGPVSPEDVDRTAQDCLRDIFRGLGVRVRELDLPTVALVHGALRGSKIGPDQPERPLGLEIPRGDLAMVGADLYAVGHVHMANQFQQGSAWLLTPTCPFFSDWGEAKHEKSYILAEFDTDIINVDPGTWVKWQRIPTPAIPMILLESTWVEGGFPEQNWPDVTGADVRLRYHYPKEKEKAAKSAAAEFERVLLVAGAIKVTLDPIPIPAITTRSAEIIKAATLQEKAKLWWQIHDVKVTPAEGTLLQDMISELQAELGFSQRLTLDAGIHIKKARIRGLRCFPDEVTIDFDALEGEVIAVSGPNGAGKSLFSEAAIPGAIFRQLPTHGRDATGNIGDHSIARDTFIETTFEYDKTYTVVHTIDGKDGTGNSSLVVDGRPVPGTDSGKRTDYDKWVVENLPPYKLFTATSFMPQESKGILGMTKGERKALILRAKGVERYEVLADAARQRAAAEGNELAQTRARLEEIGVVDIKALRTSVTVLQEQKINFADLPLLNAEEKLKAARDWAETIAKQRTEYDVLVSRHAELEEQAVELRERANQIETKIAVGREVVAEKTAIEKAVAEIAGLEREIAGKPVHDLDLRLAKETAELERLRGEHAGMVRRAGELKGRDAVLWARLGDIDTQTSQSQQVLAEADAIQNAISRSEELTRSLAQLNKEEAELKLTQAERLGELRRLVERETALKESKASLGRTMKVAHHVLLDGNTVRRAVEGLVERETALKVLIDLQKVGHEVISRLRAKLTGSDSSRISGLRGTLEFIRDEASEPAKSAGEGILSDNTLRDEAEDLPSGIREAEQVQMQIEYNQIPNKRKEVETFRALTARLPEIEQAERTLAEAKSDLAKVETDLVEVYPKQDELTEASALAESAINGFMLEKVVKEREQADLRVLTSRVDTLTSAAARIQSLTEQRQAVVVDREAINQSAVQLGNDAVDLQWAVSDAQLRVGLTTDEMKALQKTITELTAKIETLQSTANKAPFLAIAEAGQDSLLHQKSGVVKDLEEAEHKRDGIVLTVPPLAIHLAPFESAVATAQSAVSDYQTRITLAKKELTDAEAKEERRTKLASAASTLEKTIDRWNLVERTLGRNGLQADAVAAAGDEINELANEMLQASGNTKYTIDLKTTLMTKDGKKEIEGCPINVYNSETREWQEGSTLSPGQRAFVNLPLSLALAVIGCSNSTIRPTLFQDEPTAGLDEENRKQYVAMMRHAVRKVNASKMLFITHNQELMELADSRLLIGAGKVTVA